MGCRGEECSHALYALAGRPLAAHSLEDGALSLANDDRRAREGGAGRGEITTLHWVKCWDAWRHLVTKKAAATFRASL